MKKLVAAFVTLFALVTSVSAFEWKDSWQNYGGGLKEHQFIVNAGVGLNSAVFDGHTAFCPPLELSVEYTQKIWVLPFSFGGFFAYDGYMDKGSTAGVNYAHAYNNFYLGGLIKYHAMLPVENLDVYVRTQLGAYIQAYSASYSDPYLGDYDDKTSSARFYSEWGLGATWYFTDSFGLTVELGYPTVSKVSATFKF